MHSPNFDYKFSMAWAEALRSQPGHTRVQTDCLFPYAPMSRGVVRHQVSSRIRSVQSEFALETPWHNLCFICLPMYLIFIPTEQIHVFLFLF